MILSGLPEKQLNISDAALIKIKCAYAAYRDYNNVAQFYHGEADGSVFAVIGKICGYVSLWTDGRNKEELKSFLKFIGYNGIFTSLKTAQSLNLKINEECLVFKALPPFEKAETSQSASVRELLAVLRQGLTIPDADEFVADVTFRVLHGCADYVTEDGGGAVLFYDQSGALINGIAVPQNNRGKGQGSRIMKLLLSRAENREVYACCVEENKHFYIKNGFSLIGEAAYCEEE